MTPGFVSGAQWFDAWADGVLHGKPPVLWPCGHGFESVELGPGLVCLIGGAPGAGKTALAMQVVTDALRQDASLRAIVANVEMSPGVLLERQLARLAGVDSKWVRQRWLLHCEDRARAGLDVLRGIAPRLAFHTGAPTLAAVAQNADEFGAGLLVLDYLQRFAPGDGGTHTDKRSELDSVMAYLRLFADDGLGVLGLSAVSRQRGKTGSDYQSLGLASLRGSSELEFGADSVWTLAASEDESDSTVRLQCVKNRHGETPTLLLRFDKPRQSFLAADKAAPGIASEVADARAAIERVSADDDTPF